MLFVVVSPCISVFGLWSNGQKLIGAQKATVVLFNLIAEPLLGRVFHVALSRAADHS